MSEHKSAYPSFNTYGDIQNIGLTKKELVVTMLLQGMLANTSMSTSLHNQKGLLKRAIELSELVLDPSKLNE